MIISEEQFIQIDRRRSVDELNRLFDALKRDGVLTVDWDLERELEEARADAFAAGWMARATI